MYMLSILRKQIQRAGLFHLLFIFSYESFYDYFVESFSFFKDIFIIENSNNRENKKDNKGTANAQHPEITIIYILETIIPRFAQSLLSLYVSSVCIIFFPSFLLSFYHILYRYYYVKHDALQLFSLNNMKWTLFYVSAYAIHSFSCYRSLQCRHKYLISLLLVDILVVSNIMFFIEWKTLEIIT